jgi:cell division protein FtsZ
VSGPADLTLAEVRAAAAEIRAAADPDANVIFGASLGIDTGEDVYITLIASGLDEQKPAEAQVARPTFEPAPPPRRAARVTPRSQVPALHAPAAGMAGAGATTSVAPMAAIDDLELPTFLRRRRPPTTEAR